ncbi:MAG: hypothetical protein J7518_14070 [Nocardioidaceae bacterium]|nr:hypothetical protein [Nocardioidaceae bacterium]
MFRRTALGSLVAASLTAGTLMTMPAAHAAPTWTHIDTIGTSGPIPKQTASAVSGTGDVVVAWMRADRVMAASARNGVFGPAYYVSDAGKQVDQPAVAVNEHGEAVVTWVQEDNLGHDRLTGSRRASDGSWDGWDYLSPAAFQDVEGSTPQPAIDGHGTVHTAYQSTDGVTVHQILVAKWVKGSDDVVTQVISDTTSSSPSIAANEAGTVLVGWFDEQGADDRIKVRRFAAGAEFWDTEKNVSVPGTFSPEVKVALSGSGFGTAAFVQENNGAYRASSTKVLRDGTVGGSAYVSPAGASAAYLGLDQNAAGTALLSWVQVENGTMKVGYGQRKEDAGWTTGTLQTPVALPFRTVAGIADDGTTFIGYTGGQRILASYRTNPLMLWSNYSSPDVNADDGSTLGGIDSEGNAFLGASVAEADPTQGHLVGRFLDTAGPSAAMNPLPAQVMGTKFTVGWGATDRLSAVPTGSIRVRSAAFNGSFGGYAMLQLNSPAKSRVVTGTPGRTYCYSVQARDAVGNLSTWSPERCTTLPVDDRTMRLVRGFKKAVSKSFYRNTYLKATKKGSVVSLPGIKAKRIALVVGKAPTGGRIQVAFAGKNLGTYSLKGSGSKKIIASKTFGSVLSGKLVIRVVSKTGKVVRIDGVIASR